MESIINVVAGIEGTLILIAGIGIVYKSNCSIRSAENEERIEWSLSASETRSSFMNTNCT
jgi:16S rRNA C967 or C1407 C5-methylase (RsmB/RsmF family)